MKKLLLLVTILFFATEMSAIPAYKGVKKVLKLADGTEVLAELKGDDFTSYWQTADGRRFVKDNQKEVYVKADMELLNKANLRMRAMTDSSRFATAAKARRKVIGGDHGAYTGKKKGLIILVNFTDKKFKSTHTNSFYQRVANEVGFTSPLGFKGSLKDYFLSQSNGTFELDFDVIGPVELTHDYAYYGAHSNSGGNDVRPGTMIAQACQLADEQVNYADYDWDGDGKVDQVYVMYAGPGEANGGDENTIWPHEFQLENSDFGRTLYLDNTTINTYATGCELAYSYVLNKVTGKYQKVERTDGIGTICHEFSHCLGLPDMYDTRYNANYGMGSWDVMSSGNYNDNSYSPANYSSYERIYAGWVNAIELKEPTTVKGMKCSNDFGQPFIIYNDANPNEYYLLENRQQKGWDIGLANSGLIVTHVDFDAYIWGYNIVNSNYSYGFISNDHQRCTLIHADGLSGYDDEAGDTYPRLGVAGVVLNNELTNTSKPSASLYNENTDNTKLMNKPITNIVQNEDGTISFDFMGGSSTNIITGIGNVVEVSSVKDGRIYSIDGRYLGTDMNNLGKGLYIRNGVKIVK